MPKKYLQVFFVLFVLISIGLFFGFELNSFFQIENIGNVKTFFLELGNWSLLYIVLIHIVLNITGIPRVFFTIFSGYVYGILWGFIFSWIATMVGLIVTFLMVRYLFRESFEQKFGSKKVVERMNNHIDKYGIWTVVFLRAVYVVPSSILNYSFGFTKIKTSDYLLGSAIGFIPVVFVNVWFGYSIGKEEIRNFLLDYRFIVFASIVLLLAFTIKFWKAQNRVSN